ncbi:CBS domain-containing protein [Streptomyces sp. NBC_01340]|uniref:CBS domain-containing protein n=1 Tax=unclassified Streptomyces TaxID=2593676 RepID=UPI00224EBDF0|nr:MULTISPECIES: CBS domain-containing protein [unclassified Streptomyces]MCX4458913.1 CBS domain-containing protein [Streptomyces sp. NBC_01719]MCX4498270.1 CBS domain-containing protein [Streptomyces sp. NBC_01728]MCX4595862.1 CBS domain-containing protein [Streptomyces sp. NBC_01549]WSI42788.1 CBS domain-containing protein [Streptomyces sp. NBC_01340]
MLHRMVEDLMTTAVVSVRRDTGFKDIAQHLAEHDITAVPVVDDQGRPVGVVSEADLLRKQESQVDPGGHLTAAHLLPTERAKARALTAEGLMTSPAVTARPQWSVVEAARAMAQHHVKRLPVVDDADRLLGIVSRGDLVHVFLRRDLTIREEITTDVLTRTLGLDPGAVTAQVTAGRVTLSGTLPQESLIPIAVRLSESVDGVVNVTNHLRAETDTTADTPRR